MDKDFKEYRFKQKVIGELELGLVAKGDGRVDLMARDRNGAEWYLMKIRQDEDCGTVFRLSTFVPEHLGFRTNNRGCVLTSEESDAGFPSELLNDHPPYDEEEDIPF